MTILLKFDQRKLLNIHEVKDILNKAELEHQRKKSKPKFKRHRNSKQRGNNEK